MKGIIKKTLSIILCFTMVFTMFQGTMLSASAKVVGPDNKTELTITADKSKYSWGDTIIFTINVKNVTNETLKGIRINSFARNYMKVSQQGDLPVISRLEPGETKTVQIEYYATKMVGFMAIFFPVIWIFNPLARIAYKEANFNYEYRVKVGAIKYRIGFEVEYNVSDQTPDDPNHGVIIQKDQFFYNSQTNVYSFSDVIEEINGTIKNFNSVDSLYFSVVDKNGNTLDTGNIDISENWTTKEIDFLFGENNLTVFAKYDDGVLVQESMTIKCYTDAYMENLSIDSKTDTDGDGLVDYLELNYTNTAIHDVDTDSDGLTDYEEVYLFDYSPLKKDSDYNGVKDADEDYDSDKIVNIEEIRLNTDPTYNDTDIDGLNDYEELYTTNTDPKNPDSDNDGVKDGDEVRIGSNPKKKENNFIETIEYGNVTNNTPVSAKVEANVSNNQVGTLHITPVNYSDNPLLSPTVPGYLGSAYDFSVEGNITNATIEFDYDTSLGEIGKDFQPRIYYYNEEDKMFEELPNQIVENGKVTAAVSHFSTYILLNKIDFESVWESEIKPVDYQGSGMTGVDIVFVIDSSGSMSSNDGSGLRKQVVKNFVDKLGATDRAAIVDFDGSARTYQTFTSDHNLLYTATNKVDSTGGTSLSAGMREAIGLFTASDYSRTDGYKYIVFLTDGQGDYNSTYTSQAKANNIVVYTIGLGNGVNSSLLETIAKGTDGKYFFASKADDLTKIYEDISLETVDYTTDSNNDGISDYYNDLIYRGELVLSNGSNEFMGLNFNYDENQNGVLCNDFDGDGLLNGEELIVKTKNDKVYIEMISDPCMKNSDDDLYDDYLEIERGSDPMVPSYPASSLDYILDDDEYTYYAIFKGEDSTLNTIARNIWSTVTLNWSHKDEAQGLITNFLSEQAKLENIQNLSYEVEKEMAKNLAVQVTAEASKDILNIVKEASQKGDDGWSAVELIDKFVHLKINMKRWVSSGNSTNHLSSSHWTQFKAHINLFDYWSKSWKWVSKVGDVMKYLPAVNAVVGEGVDFYNITKTYSALAATSENFIIFEDILENIVSNDQMDEKYVAKGAQPILDSIRDSNYNFINDKCRDLSVATAENLGNVVINLGAVLLSSLNPFIFAINIVVGLIDEFWVGKITEGAYALYVVNEMVDAPKALFQYGRSSSYVNFEETQKIYLRFICSARSVGGAYAKQIVNKQSFIGEKDSVARERIRSNIDSDNNAMYRAYDLLGL